MSKRSYERLSIEVFGRHLILSHDLDPVYTALRRMDLSATKMSQWLIGYWCFYNCGVASYLADQGGASKFWGEMMRAARNEEPAPHGGRWARGAERRHFRGAQAVKGVEGLMAKYVDCPMDMILMLTENGTTDPLPYVTVDKRARSHPMFGPWISFKVADMVDRVLGVEVDFDEAHVFIFKDPAKAALMLWRQKQGLAENAVPKDEPKAIHTVVEYLRGELGDLDAPPTGDRPVGLQEVETVLCKWKSHMNGHYPLWNDIDEINHGVEPWLEHSETARAFRDAMPERKQGLLT